MSKVFSRIQVHPMIEIKAMNLIKGLNQINLLDLIHKVLRNLKRRNTI